MTTTPHGVAEPADNGTPGPWFVRKRERDGVLLDCFVAAPDCLGFVYDAEILGDDEYRETPEDEDAGIKRKLADCELIVEAVNAHRASQAASHSAEPVAVYLVATGETIDGQETYTRYDGAPPPLCDFERLYSAPVGAETVADAPQAGYDIDPKSSVSELAARVGAWETPEGFVSFGSWMALAAFHHHVLVGAAKQWKQMEEARAAFAAPVGAETVASVDEAEAFLRKLASLPAAVIRSSRDLSPEMIAAVRAYGDWITLRDGLAFAIMREGAETVAPGLPEGWVPLTIAFEGDDPEDVAFGPQIMMDRLKKWLDGYYALKALVNTPHTEDWLTTAWRCRAMTDAQILEVIRELGGATTSGDWVMHFGRAIAERATPPAVAVTEGASRWKLVPVEPTDAMIDATYTGQHCSDIWRDMIDAAPPPPAVAVTEGASVDVDFERGRRAGYIGEPNCIVESLTYRQGWAAGRQQREKEHVAALTESPTDERLGQAAYKGYDEYWTEDCAGRESEAWIASAKAVLALAAHPAAGAVHGLTKARTNATIVYAALTDKARSRTSRENIDDVLDALATTTALPASNEVKP